MLSSQCILQILLDGQDIEEIDPTHLRSQLAVVAQEPRLFHTTLRGNIEVKLQSSACMCARVVLTGLR